MTIDFGIDLGTTNSTIAKLNGIDAEVFKNNEGFEFTPSAVWMDSKERLHIGRRAKDRLEDDNDNAFSEFKLQMGTNTKYTFERNGKSYSPEELSSLVLKSLKDDVRRQMGVEVNSVVITVPAAFQLPPCNATNKAAEKAGFTNHPLLQEPIAAAMAYGFQSNSDNKFWMVYDFGGGTFDAAVVQIKDGQIEVINHGGDNGLGGKNLDWEIVNKILVPAVVKDLKPKNFTRDNKEYSGAFAKLKAEAEKAKIRLSLEDSVEIIIDNLYKNEKGEAIEFICEIFKSDFKKLAKPFISRSINICKQVLIEKRLGTSNIEKMIMVGGTSLIPFLRDMLMDPNKGLGIPLESSLYPITVVAKGAAIFAGTQMAPTTEKMEVKNDEFLLELDYQPVGSDTEPPIGGKIVTDMELDFSKYTIEFVNKTVRPEWRSGKIKLSSNGGFVNQLWAEKGKKNEFNIELYNASGVKQKTIPETISYTFGIVSAEAPLIHSIGIAMANNETDFLLNKGVSLPAKNRSFHRTISEIRVGQSEDVINIPIIEGENRHRADHNRLIGSLSISSDKIKRTLPAGSEIEITLVVDTSRLVKAKAYIPILDEEFEVDANLIIEPGKIEEMVADFSKDKDKYKKLLEKSKNESDSKATAILEQIESENILNEIDSLLESAKVDPDSRNKAKNRMLDFNTILDYAEDAVEWPTMVMEAKEKIQDTKKISEEYGTGDDKNKFSSLEKEIETAISEKDPDLLRRRINQMDGFYWILLRQQPGFWVNCLNYARDNKDTMRDKNEADHLITLGDRAIQKNDVEGLKTAVQSLYDLLPVAEQEKLGFGGSTVRA